MYFGEMELSENEKLKRIEMSKRFQDSFFFVLTLISVFAEFDRLTMEEAISRFKSAYMSIIIDYVSVDDYIKKHIDEFCEQVSQTTIDHLEDDYYLSEERAIFMAQNETNDCTNYDQYSKAIKSGAKTKTWHSIIDKKTRKSHVKMNGKTIPIDNLFVVGNNALMRFPCDTEYASDNPEEIIGCRCSCSYN